MPLVDLFRRRGLTPSWEFTTRGIIWRLHPAPDNRLIGEERDINEKTVSFFCLDLGDGIALWKGRNYGEQWWAGIEAVYRDVLFLHGFAAPDLPEHKGVTAIDTATGATLWKNEHVKFVSVENGAIGVERTTLGATTYQELDFRTGGVLREVAPETRPMNLVHGSQYEVDDVTFPSLLPEGISGTTPLSIQLRTVCEPETLAGPVEVAESDEYVIVAFHEQSNDPASVKPLLKSIVAIIARRSGEIMLREVLDDAITFPMPNSFLLRASTVYFVRNRRTLTAIPLKDKKSR